MSQPRFEYWRPGEPRKLRMFMSHRWEGDRGLYDDVFAELKSMRFRVSDTSLSEEQGLAGVRGGKVNELALRAEIAARIYSSDIIVARSRVATSRSDWLKWEIATAVVCYSLPILFVDHGDVERRTGLVAQVKALGGRCELAARDKLKIAFGVRRLVNPTQHQGVVSDETDHHLYRGPVKTCLDDVFSKLPYVASVD